MDYRSWITAGCVAVLASGCEHRVRASETLTEWPAVDMSAGDTFTVVAEGTWSYCPGCEVDVDGEHADGSGTRPCQGSPGMFDFAAYVCHVTGAPFGMLVAEFEVGTRWAGAIPVGRGGTFTAPADGTLVFRMNDIIGLGTENILLDEYAFDDNSGSVKVEYALGEDL